MPSQDVVIDRTKQDDATGIAEKVFEKIRAEPMVYLIAESVAAEPNLGDVPGVVRGAELRVSS